MSKTIPTPVLDRINYAHFADPRARLIRIEYAVWGEAKTEVRALKDTITRQAAEIEQLTAAVQSCELIRQQAGEIEALPARGDAP